jgi:hypothetical protein
LYVHDPTFNQGCDSHFYRFSSQLGSLSSSKSWEYKIQYLRPGKVTGIIRLHLETNNM